MGTSNSIPAKKHRQKNLFNSEQNNFEAILWWKKCAIYIHGSSEHEPEGNVEEATENREHYLPLAARVVSRLEKSYAVCEINSVRACITEICVLYLHFVEGEQCIEVRFVGEHGGAVGDW